MKVMSAYGIRQTDIGREVGLRSPKTLRKHFREELDRGRIEANIKVGKALFEMATSGKHVSATIYWLNRQAGWSSRPAPMATPTPIPDFVVACEKEAA